MPDDPITVRPLSPDQLPSFLRFFDHDAFGDNPAWAGCYCMFYQLAPATNEEWNARTAEQNRSAQSESIRAGHTHGLLAYAGEQAVGWCHAAPLAEFPGLRADEDWRVPDVDVQATGAIVCFLIAPAYRRQGIARQLLDAACAYLAGLGLRVVEAYAPRAPKSAAGAYHGPLALYLAAGFEPASEHENFVLVRKTLTGG